jgi:hypothetical protein
MMSVKPKPIIVDTETNLVGLFSRANEEVVLLEYRGTLFRLDRVEASDDLDGEPNREEVLRMLDRVAGSWSDLDPDQHVEEIYEARRAGSRPSDRS